MGLLVSLVNNIYKYLVPEDLTMNKMIMIAVSVVVVLLIIVALIFFFYHSRSKSGESGSPGILNGSENATSAGSGNSNMTSKDK